MDIRFVAVFVFALGINSACFVSEPILQDVDVKIDTVTANQTEYTFSDTIRANTVMTNIGENPAIIDLEVDMYNTSTFLSELGAPLLSSVELAPGEKITIEVSFTTPGGGASTQCYWRSFANVPGDIDLSNNVGESLSFKILSQ